MAYDNRLVAAKLKRWERFLNNYTMPDWDALPDLELYMDQVIVLLGQYLNYIPDEDREKLITQSIINNYVRMKIIPAPNKKRYGRVHLAYLIIVCSLKQSLNIASIQKLIPIGISEEEVKTIYNHFAATYKQFCSMFIDIVRRAAEPIIEQQDDESGSITENMVMTAAISSNIAKVFTEKLIKLRDVPIEDMLDQIN